jgi:leukotriene-A4 hydrolase
MFNKIKTVQALTLLAFISMATACQPDHKQPLGITKEENTSLDMHTYARPDAVIKHLSLDLSVDFVTKQLSGTATYDIDVKENADSLYLDTRNLEIGKIEVDGKDTPYHIGADQEWMGAPLAIPVNKDSKKILIHYATSPTGAEALQWLEPSQTAGKKEPYLFTQGEAILTRTWIPIQDSPGIRFTYDAKISVPSQLMAVMSATNPQTKTADGVYNFKMNQPIPAYLIALAVGDLEFRAIGDRTGVYSEPSVVDKAAYELVDMQKMVETAESLYGPYQWERYDVIVLPPSFPFGGMENPRLTFATPTILAGDRSLVALIAHELAHSWSGNLVTNATWNDFWLNEGFTVYFETRIMEALYGKSYSDMLRSLGYQSLQSTLKELKPEETHLSLDLHGKNPDDGMNDIAYEKGALFLTMLEQTAGREKFDAFLRKYFDEHKFQSMTTAGFLDYLDKELLKPNNLNVNVDAWVYSPGLPADVQAPVSERFIKVDEQVKNFLGGAKASSLAVKEWSTHEWLHFLLALPDSLPTAKMTDLDKTFSLTNSHNSEIQEVWYKLSINQGYAKGIMPSIRSFLVNVGRRKFLTPLYTTMIDKGMKADAQSIYKEARPNYHSVAYNTLDKLFAE